MTIHIKILTPTDAGLFANIAPELYDNSIDPERLTEFLADPRHHIAVAMDEQQMVGFASAVHYVHPDKRAELWINEVAVAATHRRLGLATRLLGELFRRGRELRCAQAWVLAEPPNAPAMSLYSSLEGIPTDAVMFTFRLENDASST